MINARMAIPSPADSQAVVRFAVAALQSQDEETAIATVLAGIRHAPEYAPLWQVLGLLYRARYDLQEAMEALDRAAELSPSDGRIAHGRAQTYLDAGQPALTLFDMALALAPRDEGVRLGRYNAMADERGLSATIDALSAEIDREPHWAAGQGALARMKWMAGDEVGYISPIGNAVRQAPRNLDLWRELLVALSYAQRHEEMLTAAKAGEAAAGPHLMFTANQAVALDELGRLREAGALFSTICEANDHNVDLYRVRHELRSSRLQEAGSIAERWTGTPFAPLFWPYLSTVWRLTSDPRWAWLEGDERLVGVYDLAGRISSIDALAERLRSIHFASSQPVDQSLRGGTQTTGNLFSRIDPEISELRKVIAETVATHISRLPPMDRDHPILSAPRGNNVRFTGSWSVRLRAQGHHVAHVHPGGWISSAFYVALPEDSEGNAGFLSLGEPPSELGLPLQPLREIEPEVGRLVLFPSIMWHGTVPFAGGERLTVAFDVARPLDRPV